ncbi:sensor histidine kinase [Streptomyces sp. N2-109]|uniref:histidine kinase n=1 Tax=Streptomyces gossypii TaxID=2883101 RepID=A0ABT2JV31_9ACTN|nr:sensor histidine kinase [Streptomyces gossypii]MCT2591741.1 sensor histidine kinase [Streptomyces gossypii]
MKTREVAGRAGRALRAVPCHLREDLWAVGAAPLPHTGRPRWLDWRPALVMPLALCAALLHMGLTNSYVTGFGMDFEFGVLIAGTQSLALVVALFRPLPAWWTSVIALIVVTPYAKDETAAALPWTGAGLALQAALLFLLALRVRPRAAVEALTISAGTGLVCGAFIPGHHLADTRFPVAVLVGTVAVAAAWRSSQVARSRLFVQEELTAGERARRTVLEERNRIARELHDVVAHHMSVISIQAQVAPHLAEKPSEELRENLAGIRENAVEALTELRRVLGVLRTEDALAKGVRDAPQPTLDLLDELVGKVRAAGLTVTTRVTGERRPLPPGVELSAFRIVQEALSNAMRHAPGAGVRVEIGYPYSGVTIRVTNTAPVRGAVRHPQGRGRVQAEHQEAGHGLLGMRERAAMLGGELASGATGDGGYEVTAVLPAASSIPKPPADRVKDAP